jgi:hypothetical protein
MTPPVLNVLRAVIGTGTERAIEVHLNYIDQILVNVGLVSYVYSRQY